MKGLPTNATYPQIENEFKRFGAIKTGGIQIRSQKVGLTLTILATLELHILSIFLKQQGFCFGFVEFEESSSAQSAIEVSPFTLLSFLITSDGAIGEGHANIFITVRGYWINFHL